MDLISALSDLKRKRVGCREMRMLFPEIQVWLSWYAFCFMHIDLSWTCITSADTHHINKFR